MTSLAARRRGALDKSTHGNECGGRVEVEADGGSVAVGHPAELAEAVRPGMGSFDGPAPCGLDRGGSSLVRDLAGEAQAAEGLAGDHAVITSMQVAGSLVWQHAAELGRGGLQGGTSSGDSCRFAPAAVMLSGMP